MVEWVKQNHPHIEIVLGGYGTAVFKESFETSDKLKELADYICYGEGVNFLNTVIFNKWGIRNQKKLRQDLLPAINSFYRTRIEIFKQIILVKGLGCTYGCAFCSTSSQFNRRYIPLFTSQQLFESLLEQAKKHPEIQSAIIYEEDFLSNRKNMLEFMDYFNKSELQNRPFLITVFASLNSIMNYSIEELIQCGIGTIFIGVESLSEKVLQEEGLSKRKGEIESFFHQLHAHGINTLGSLVIGWDSQNEEIANADADRFVAMNPTFYQVVPLHVVPGTKLWENMKQDGRIAIDYKVELDGITDFNFESRSFSHVDALKLVFSTYTKLVNEGGPWPFRMFENLLNGYLNLKDKTEPLFITRSEKYKKMLFPVCFLAFVSRVFFFGKSFRKRWNHTMMLFFKTSPHMFALCLLLSPIILLLLSGIYLIANLIYFLNPKGDQPDYIRKEYPLNPSTNGQQTNNP